MSHPGHVSKKWMTLMSGCAKCGQGGNAKRIAKKYLAKKFFAEKWDDLCCEIGLGGGKG